MKRFLIKVTYLTGRHKGKTYFLKKRGYVCGENEYVFADEAYATEAIAKRVCTIYRNNNKRDYDSERSYNNYKISKGEKGKEWFIYELESYEPYELNEDYVLSI